MGRMNIRDLMKERNRLKKLVQAQKKAQMMKQKAANRERRLIDEIKSLKRASKKKNAFLSKVGAFAKSKETKRKVSKGKKILNSILDRIAKADIEKVLK